MSNIYIQEPPSNGKSGARVHCPRRRCHRHLDGGESIYGWQFKDEFHSRLHFNRRGLVAMANAGPHDNGSQFFFTLGRADELNDKHTIFGKVTGDTMYNMLRLAEMECDPEERPLNPHKLQTTEVLHSPFDDIIPCETKESQKDEDKKWGKKSQSKATKCLIYYYTHFLCSSLSICC